MRYISWDNLWSLGWNMIVSWPGYSGIIPDSEPSESSFLSLFLLFLSFFLSLCLFLLLFLRCTLEGASFQTSFNNCSRLPHMSKPSHQYFQLTLFVTGDWPFITNVAVSLLIIRRFWVVGVLIITGPPARSSGWCLGPLGLHESSQILHPQEGQGIAPIIQ